MTRVESQEASTQLLKNKYDLHKSPEVETAAKRTQTREGERVSQDPLARIQNYLNRFHEIIERGGPDRREHNLNLIKGRFHAKYVIKPDEIPESFWENQKRLIRERGQGADLDRAGFEELKRQNTEAIIADQTSSLDKWIDYLSSPDAPYSDALKYFTLRNVLNMAEYDKEKKMYPQRSKGTTKPFPDLNREALAYVLDAIDKKYASTGSAQAKPGEHDAEFENLLKGENFPKLYAWAIEKVTPASEEELQATRGEWIKYNQGSDHMPLVQSLQGHGTGWCTAGESTAQIQLQGGDFYVYYSLDREGRPTVPRVAIRMEGSRIAEVRGIAADQNLDGGAVPIVEEKLKEFPDGASYKKRVSDMRRLTEIERKVDEGSLELLSREDLIFLYEIDSPIQGFGFSRDPRIDQLRLARSPEVDMLIIFNSEPEQIAHHVSQIRPDTKAYVGRLEPGIFDLIKKYNIEHVYTSFPEGKIQRQTIEIGGKSEKQLEQELEERDINISTYARDMMRSPDFTTLPNPQSLDTFRLSARDLRLSGTPTTEQVYARAKELGLELCPAEVGPHLTLKDKDQPLNDWYWIAMKQIADRDGNPNVFVLPRSDGGLWLYDNWARPRPMWSPGRQFIFSLRK